MRIKYQHKILWRISAACPGRPVRLNNCVGFVIFLYALLCVCFFIYRFYMYVYMSMDFAQHRTPKLFEGMIKPALRCERFVRLGVYNERNRNRLGAGSNCCPINGKGCPNWIAQSVGWISVRICLFP